MKKPLAEADRRRRTLAAQPMTSERGSLPLFRGPVENPKTERLLSAKKVVDKLKHPAPRRDDEYLLGVAAK